VKIPPILLLVASACVCVQAVPFYGNQSSVVWKSAETEHFVFNYPLEYQGEVEKVVSFAEAVHDSVENRYRVKLPGKVNMNVRNALFSNGLASPINNTMNIWLTDWDFKTRSTHHWMNDVVTHEFSHLVSIQSGSKVSPIVHGLQFSWQSYYNQRTQSQGAVVLPNNVYPLWFAEGTAQYESARMGYDSWDTHRDMLLRTLVLDDSLLALEDMRDFPDNALGSELGPYTQGFNLVRYISERFGDKAIPNLWAELSRIHRVTFSAACVQVLGISEEQLYRDWKAARLEHYIRQRDGLGKLVIGQKRSREAFWQDFPQVEGGALYGVSNMGSAWFEGGIFKLPLLGDSLKSLDSLPKEKRPDSLGTLSMADFAKNPFHLTKPWLEKGFSIRTFKDRSPLVAYVSYKNRDRNGRAFFDIAVDDTSANPWFGVRKSLRFVTHLADATYPDLSPKGDEVVFVRRIHDSSRFALSRAAVPGLGATVEDMVDLFMPADTFSNFGVYTPKYSPDGQSIVFSYYDGVSRKVAVIGRDGKNLRMISDGAFDSRDPAWSLDGKAIYYSCDKSGIFNLYRQDLLATAPVLKDSTGQIITSNTLATMPAPVALTNVIGGAFTPAVDSNKLWYVGYDKDGFSLYELPLHDSLQAKPSGKRLTGQPTAIGIGHVELQSIQRKYLPIPKQPLVVPLFSMEGKAKDLAPINQGTYVPMVGVALGLQDPLQKNYLQLALLLEMGKGFDYVKQTGINPAMQSELMGTWENHSFPITLGLAYMRRNTPSRDTVRYEDPRSYSDSLAINPLAVGVQAIEASAGYSLFKEGDSLVVSASDQWATFNLYQDGFSWDYLRSLRLSSRLSYESGTPEEQSAIAGEGNGITLTWQGSRSQLYHPGTFRTSFTVNSQGVISPIYQNYLLNELWLAAWFGLDNPIHDGARLVLGVQASGIASWSGPKNVDTLDYFFHHGLNIAGYPTLATNENLLLHGDRTWLGQAHYLIPLYRDLNKTLWIFTIKSFYADVFAQAGTAWWQSSNFAQQFAHPSQWMRSTGIELRWSNKLFMNQAFDVSLNLARALDEVSVKGQNQSVGNIKVPFLPSAVEPTAISIQVGFQFNDPWLGMKQANGTLPQ